VKYTSNRKYTHAPPKIIKKTFWKKTVDWVKGLFKKKKK